MFVLPSEREAFLARHSSGEDNRRHDKSVNRDTEVMVFNKNVDENYRVFNKNVDETHGIRSSTRMWMKIIGMLAADVVVVLKMSSQVVLLAIHSRNAKPDDIRTDEFLEIRFSVFLDDIRTDEDDSTELLSTHQ